MKNVLYILLILLAAGCTSQKRADSETGKTWSGKMEDMSNTLRDLVPYVFNKTNYLDEGSESKISSHLEEFYATVKSFDYEKGLMFTEADPGLKFTIKKLNSDVDRAVESFKSGNKNYSRQVMKSVLQNCFFCHTRNRVGPEFDLSLNQLANIRKLKPIEKSDILLSLRDYDNGLAVLKAYIKHGKKELGWTFDLDRSISKYLTIVVRVKKDPQLGIKIIDELLKRDDLALYLKDDIKVWRQSLRKWSKEVEQNKSHMIEANRLMKEAKYFQKYQRDRGGLIYYLRASSHLHQYLQIITKDKERAKIFFKLGNIYDLLNEDLGFWSMSDWYYEACIMQLPHSSTAEKCYKRIEENIYMGYTGSAGTYIPSKEQLRLKNLKELAMRRSYKQL